LDSLQQLHLAYLCEMYQKGYANISGPFEVDSDIHGVTIYNVPTMEMADSLARADPWSKQANSKLKSIRGGPLKDFHFGRTT
jgi:uncharacterized protein YciI